jgi:hypothetical protein
MPRSINRVALRCGLLALAVAAEGCQRNQTWKLAPVEGTVTQAGRPLAGIQVTFWADVEAGTQGPRSSSVTDSAGHYELHTDAGEQGAAIGRYRICLVDTHYVGRDLLGGPLKMGAKTVQERKKQLSMEASPPPRVPLSYGQLDKTLLRVEVQPGPQVIDFDIKDTDVEVKPIGVLGK